MDNIEKEYIDDLPVEMNYPALKTMALVSNIAGTSLFILALLWLLFIVFSMASAYFTKLEYPQTKDLLNMLIPFGMIFVAFPFMLNAEVIHLLIDLQGNADRQSILLTLILRRMEKGKP